MCALSLSLSLSLGPFTMGSHEPYDLALSSLQRFAWIDPR